MQACDRRAGHLHGAKARRLNRHVCGVEGREGTQKPRAVIQANAERFTRDFILTPVLVSVCFEIDAAEHIGPQLQRCTKALRLDPPNELLFRAADNAAIHGLSILPFERSCVSRRSKKAQAHGGMDVTFHKWGESDSSK
ncbi:MAG: hypothetical protein ACK56I_25695, partial [bacterium]